MITISSEAEVVRNEFIRELQDLSTRESLSGQEKRRFEALKILIKKVSEGMPVSELVGSDVKRLEDEVRGFSFAKRIPMEAELDWRDFISGTSKRRYQMLGNNEVRAVQEVGSQSISYTAEAAGGAFVPVGFQDRQIASMAAYDEIFDDANHNRIDTPTGNPMTLPSIDDVENEAVLVTDNTNPGAQPIMNAGVNQLQGYSYRGGQIFVSMETLQDTGVPIGNLLERAFAIRMARGVGKHLVLGSGSSQPTGLLTSALEVDNITYAEGANANTGVAADTMANSIGTLDLFNTYFGLNRAYRREATWAMSDGTFLSIVGLTDKVGRPLVKYATGMDDIATLYGRPIVICPSMPNVAPNAPVVAFYVPRHFYVRHVARGNYVVMSYQHPGAVEFGNVSFQSFSRFDSVLAVPNAQYPPVSVLQLGS